MLHWYIESVIVDSKVKIDPATKVQSVPFYVAFMVGDQAQRETYARILLSITQDGTSDDINQRVTHENEKYFTKDMCQRIL